MGSHPINLALRLLLEIAAFISMAYWGWTQHTGFQRYAWAIGLPLVWAVLWGTFNVPDDPSRSSKAPVRVPGFMRPVGAGFLWYRRLGALRSRSTVVEFDFRSAGRHTLRPIL